MQTKVEHTRWEKFLSLVSERPPRRFLNTSGLSPKRFCWDFWHVPDQYSFHRTVAEEYFADLSDARPPDQDKGQGKTKR